MSVESVKAEIVDMNPEERAAILTFLVDGFEDSGETSEAWKSEIDRRVDEIRAGTVKGIDGDEVFRRIDESLGR